MCKQMLITKINLSKGESFSTAVWREATQEEKEKVFEIFGKLKSS